MGLQLRPAADTASSAMDTSSHETSWVGLARRLWIKDSPVFNVKPEIIKTDIWDPLEAERFSLRSLAALENLQILEK